MAMIQTMMVTVIKMMMMMVVTDGYDDVAIDDNAD